MAMYQCWCDNCEDERPFDAVGDWDSIPAQDREIECARCGEVISAMDSGEVHFDDEENEEEV